MIEISVYWSFRSPFSYLALPRLRQLQQEFDVCFYIKPVWPLALRDAGFFKNKRPQQFPYMFRDMHREAQKADMLLRFPAVPDPIAQNLMTLEIASEQPLIERLMHIGAAAQDLRGKEAFPLFEEISSLIFDGNTDNWHEGDHLARAASQAGFDLEALEQHAFAHHDSLIKLIEKNETEQEPYHWGVPLMVYGDEPFFGQDRIDTLRWRFEQDGLQKVM